MKWELPQRSKQVVHKICTIFPKEIYPDDIKAYNMLFFHDFEGFVKMFVIKLIYRINSLESHTSWASTGNQDPV